MRALLLETFPVEHSGPELLAHACPEDPWKLVKAWLEEASQFFKTRFWMTKKRLEWNAAQLSTVDNAGYPKCRTVLVKEVSSARGFVFFTDRESEKARQIRSNDEKCSLLFYWPYLSRQLIVTGRAREMARTQVLRWWVGRSLVSCATAAAAPQSSMIEDRAAWKAQIRENLRRMRQGLQRNRLASLFSEAGSATGFGVMPECIEFWQGQPGRAHDRVIYEQSASAGTELPWNRRQLAP